FVRFALGDTACKRLVKAVNLVFVIFLLIDNTLVKRQFFPVKRFLLIAHFAFKFSQQGPYYGFQPSLCFSGFFCPLGMLAVVSVANQLLALPCITLTLLNTRFFGYFIAFVDNLFTQFGIGGKS